MVAELIEQILGASASPQDSDVEEMVELVNQLHRIARPEHIPALLAAINHPEGDFWTRETFGEILCDMERPELLSPLLTAFDRNMSEGHDNDGFQVGLIDLVESQPESSRRILQELKAQPPSGISVDTIDWLLEFCQQ